MSKKPRKSIVEQELRETFELFDKDKNGYISLNELRAIMKNIGEDLSDIELENLLKEYDDDRDGRINCEG
jgi:calmodulin